MRYASGHYASSPSERTSSPGLSPPLSPGLSGGLSGGLSPGLSTGLSRGLSGRLSPGLSGELCGIRVVLGSDFCILTSDFALRAALHRVLHRLAGRALACSPPETTPHGLHPTASDLTLGTWPSRIIARERICCRNQLLVCTALLRVACVAGWTCE